MNQHMIIGNLVHDPETGTTEGGVNWCRFKVAVRKKYKPKDGQPDADFIRVTAWRGLGDTCAKYLKKGRKVCVVGVPQAGAWIGQDGKAKGQIELTAEAGTARRRMRTRRRHLAAQPSRWTRRAG